MRYIVKAKIRTLLAQQSGHIQLLIFAPILTLFLLSLVVRTANSAIDPTLEKKKITQQLKQRLVEVRQAEGSRPSLALRRGEEAQPAVKISKSEESVHSAEKPPIVQVKALSYEKAPSLDSREGAWTAAGNDTGHTFLLSLRADAAFVASESKAPAPSTRNSLDIPWRIAKNNSSSLLLSPALVTAQNKKKDKKPQIVAKVPSIEETKIALEKPVQKTPGIRLASIESHAALSPFLVSKPIQKEEPVGPRPEYLPLQIKKDETLEKILKREGVSAGEASQWIKATQKLGEFRLLRPGKTLELFFSQDVETPGLKTLIYVPEEGTRLILERKTPKRIEATRIQPLTEPVWLVLGGRIEKNFSKSIKKIGLPEQIVKGVMNLEWAIDLSDLHAGDSFKILVEAVQRGQKISAYKTLLAAEINNDGQTFTAFLLPEEHRLLQRKKFEEEYKDQGLEIESEGQKFLRFPLEFLRISSSFSGARFHPILHLTRRHNGIDFAAPRGTPVYSVANGTVTFVGRQSGYGNVVKIDHPGPYETAYAHLQGFAAGLEEGAEIGKGNVVGYVGSTGLATGPHLHFELLRNGMFVDPSTEREEAVAMVHEEKPDPVNPIVEAKKKALAEKLATLEIGSQSFASVVIPQQRGKVATAADDHQKGIRRQASSEENAHR